jgi:hypothetical protein
MQKKTATKDQIITELWYRGQLSWILYPHQRPIYDKIREVLASDDPDMNSFVIDCARQFGKSFTEVLIAVEECLQNPDHTIVFIGPLKSQVNEIVNGKTFGTIFKTCPKELVPTFKDSALNFANGSRIRLAGTDNHNYESLRGGSANTIFLDEAGYMSNLEDGVLSTVEPMTKTTGGKVIFSSTPPESIDHDYYEVLRFHEEAGLIATFTVWDDKSLTEKQLQKIISQCKGRDTNRFKREYECARISDASRAVIPQLSIENPPNLILSDNRYRDNPFHPHWKRYVVADWGGRDKTAIIFAHYNYKTKKVIVEDQLDLNGDSITGGRIAEGIKAKTKLLWNDEGSINYFCDNNNILIQNEMLIRHKLPFVATDKGKLKSQMVEKVKDWIFDDRCYFAPEAELVFKCMRSAHWSKNGDEFSRSKIYGHYDHLAAYVYLIRNIDEDTDPIPDSIIDRSKYLVMPKQLTQPDASVLQSLRDIFYNPNKRRF